MQHIFVTGTGSKHMYFTAPGFIRVTRNLALTNSAQKGWSKSFIWFRITFDQGGFANTRFSNEEDFVRDVIVFGT